MAKNSYATPVNITFICTLSCSFRHTIFTCYFSSLSNFRFSVIFSKDSQPLLSYYYLTGTHVIRGARAPGA